MVDDYLAGGLSVLLQGLQSVAQDCPRLASGVLGLVRQAEDGPVTALPGVTVQAVNLTDQACWHALDGGDARTFCETAAVASRLHEFAVAARFVPNRRWHA
ncbi:MAG TPA: hypothetical protein VNG13_13690 [Mycobacteriales bacterium]|nr:hypothetical protein [Mycobacteriales bacterium]